MTVCEPRSSSTWRGSQSPRFLSVPESDRRIGREAVELARLAGLVLDPWQELVIEHSLGQRSDRRFSAFEVGLIVSRQNGKGSVLEARELAGLFLLGERLIVHTAHLFDTALEAFRRVLALIEDSPALDQRVKRVSKSHGEEGIELKTGARLRFKARTASGGRGFSGDCVILDEAMELSATNMAALLPTLSARPNPQVWYTGSAPLPHSAVFHALRRRGRAGGSPRLAFFEWSAPDDAGSADRQAWGTANPALGIRISEDFIEAEQAAMPDGEFRCERLGISPDDLADGLLGMTSRWAALSDPASSLGRTLAFALDVTPDRDHAAIGVAGPREDGRLHVEAIESRDGLGWVVARLVELKRKWRPTAIALDPGTAAGGLIGPLQEAGLELTFVNARQYAQACGEFYDAVIAGRIAHLGQANLDAAVAGARQKPLGEAWKWARAGSADISPLVAVTLAHWATPKAPRKPKIVNLAAALEAQEQADEAQSAPEASLVP